MKCLIFDANSVLNRAFYGIPVLSNKNGFYTNGIYGFLNIYAKYMDEEKPDYVITAFDLKAKTFRHKMYDGYKANRHGTPEELAVQFEPLKDILKEMGVPILQVEGFEADDIIGTISVKCAQSLVQCVIVTGDRDDLQLVNESVTVRLTLPKAGSGRSESTDYTIEKIRETYGLEPNQLIEVKGLMGDTSDNIPGVKGVGEKTALTLIQNFHTLEGVYENIDSKIIKPACREKLIADREMAELSRILGTIVTDVPLPQLSDLKINNRNAENLRELLEKYELYSLINKFALNTQPRTRQAIATPSVQETVTEKSIKILPYTPIEAVEKTELLAAIKDEIAIYLCEEQLYIAVKESGKIKTAEYTVCRTLLTEMVEEDITAILFNPEIKKISYNYKGTAAKLREYGYTVNGFSFDILIASYIADCNTPSSSPEELLIKYSPDSPTEDGVYMPHICAGELFRLKDMFKRQINEIESEYVLNEIDSPLVEVLEKMEDEGFLLDSQRLKLFGNELNINISVIESFIYDTAGKVFNIGSPKQLGEVLFETLKLPAIKKNKSGYSTDNEVLEELYEKHTVIPEIIKYRQLTKLKSTYVEGLLKTVSDDGRVRTTFNQALTLTGRLSSVEPNMQNIPVRGQFGA